MDYDNAGAYSTIPNEDQHQEEDNVKANLRMIMMRMMRMMIVIRMMGNTMSVHTTQFLMRSKIMGYPCKGPSKEGKDDYDCDEDVDEL